MEKIECTSCKQEIPLVETYVKFECPECEEIIYRCQKCRLTHFNLALVLFNLFVLAVFLFTFTE